MASEKENRAARAVEYLAASTERTQISLKIPANHLRAFDEVCRREGKTRTGLMLELIALKITGSI